MDKLKIMRYLIFTLVIIIMQSCSLSKKEQAELILINGNIYTVNENFEKAQAFAVKNGRFLAVGTNEEILKFYESKNVVDAKNQTILPGLIDAHCHFFGLGMAMQNLDLEGSRSFRELVEKVIAYQKKKIQRSFLEGAGIRMTGNRKYSQQKTPWICSFQIRL